MSDKGKTTPRDYTKPLRFPDDHLNWRVDHEALGRLIDQKIRNLSFEEVAEIYRETVLPALTRH